jgi:O-antigen ligase
MLLKSSRSLTPWNVTLAAVAIFPILPIFGGVGLLYAALRTWQQHHFTWRVRSPLLWSLGIITLWLLLTSLVAAHRVDAWLGVANFLPFFLIFIFFSHIIEHPCQLRPVAWRFFLPSSVVILLGFGQLLDGWTTPDFLRNLTVDEIYPYGRPLERMSSLFMYANILAAYLLVVFILGLGLWLDTLRRVKQGKEKIRRWRLSAIALLVAADGVALVLTNSRNAWGIAFFACLVFALYLGWGWLVGIFSLMAGAISLAAWGPKGIREIFRGVIPVFIWLRLSDQVYQDNRPLPTLRSSQWQFCWERMLERPWLGWGLRNFTPLYKEATDTWLGHPHNLYLMLGLETGFVGLGLLAVWVGWIMVQGGRLYRKLGEDSLIFFTYLTAFGSCILFNILDVTVLDGKLNALNWILLGSIGAIVRNRAKFRVS